MRTSKTITSLTLLFLLFASPGCLLSLKSIATKNNTITSDALEGSWEGEKSKDGWTISRVKGSKGYKFTHRDPESRIAVFKGHLLKIQDKLFIEIIATEPPTKDANVYQVWTHIPTYLILHVPSLDSELQLSDVKPNWLKDTLKKNPKQIEHVKLDDDRIVLTDKPDKVQSFLLQAVGDSNAMGEVRKYQKILD